MKKSMTGAEVGTAAGITAGIAAGITAGIATAIAGLLAGEYFFHIALDASTDKSALLKPAPGTEKKEKVPGEERNAPEAVTMLKAQYEEREIESFDQLRLHGYLCRQKKPNKKWAVLIHGYDDSGMWFGREALAFYQAGFNLLLPDARGHGKSQGTYVGMGWHDRLDIKEWICWLNWSGFGNLIIGGIHGSCCGHDGCRREAAFQCKGSGGRLWLYVRLVCFVISDEVPVPSACVPIFILRGFCHPHKGRLWYERGGCIEMRGRDQTAHVFHPRHGGPVCSF